MFVEELKSVFADWGWQGLSTSAIKYRELSDPEFDPNDDYRVIYEVSFEPAALDKARIEFWVTDTGHVAVGIETYERIGKRLGLRTTRHGFVAGHEPRKVTKDGLQRLFDTVTSGRIFIVVKSALRAVISAKIYMFASDVEAMIRSGYQCSDWISALPDDAAQSALSSLGKVANYRPW